MIQLGMGDGDAMPGDRDIDRHRARLTRLIGKVDAAWTSFHASYTGLSDEELLVPGVAGEWSVRDLIAHITWWDEEAIAHLPTVLEGGRPPRYSVMYGGIDAFNATKFDEKRHLSLHEVRHEAEETHRILIAYLRSVPIEKLAGNSRFTHRLRLDTYGHYSIHTDDIRHWRVTRGI